LALYGGLVRGRRRVGGPDGLRLLRRPDAAEELVHVHGSEVLVRPAERAVELVEGERVDRALPRQRLRRHRRQVLLQLLLLPPPSRKFHPHQSLTPTNSPNQTSEILPRALDHQQKQRVGYAQSRGGLGRVRLDLTRRQEIPELARESRARPEKGMWKTRVGGQAAGAGARRRGQQEKGKRTSGARTGVAKEEPCAGGHLKRRQARGRDEEISTTRRVWCAHSSSFPTQPFRTAHDAPVHGPLRSR
jgi:hypothetical protein